MDLTLVIDPRFSGGTSSAVAREINALACDYRLSVVAISSQHFKGKAVHHAIEDACEQTGTQLRWDPPFISSDLVALHNPSFLKFDTSLTSRIHCDRLFVVCHENFLRPGGAEGFDVGHCLSLISVASLCRQKYLMPVSGWNRQGVEAWSMSNPSNWKIGPSNWFNICDFDMAPATSRPRDRRGRHSRAGPEKFPGYAALSQMFSDQAESVRIMGADSLMSDDRPARWELLPFGAEPVDHFLQTLDFFIYFTNPMWQESFGRVIAEAIAAGKVVIASPETALSFGNGVIAAEPAEVDHIVARLIENPAAYADQVQRGQEVLRGFGVDAFRSQLETLVTSTQRANATGTQLERMYDFL